jgi:septum formation protein
MLGLPFDIVPADIDESYAAGESPDAHAERLARAKASAVLRAHAGSLVIGSDTVVVVGGTVLGKPRHADDAVRMLMQLQGREHTVATGIAAAQGSDVRSAVELVRVRFRPFDEEMARAYVNTGEPLDKAGAYGIQGYGAVLVDRIEGDFFAVMGLPIRRLIALLEALGWHYHFPGLRRA